MCALVQQSRQEPVLLDEDAAAVVIAHQLHRLGREEGTRKRPESKSKKGAVPSPARTHTFFWASSVVKSYSIPSARFFAAVRSRKRCVSFRFFDMFFLSRTTTFELV